MSHQAILDDYPELTDEYYAADRERRIVIAK
jgi:hypothetical protein